MLKTIVKPGKQSEVKRLEAEESAKKDSKGVVWLDWKEARLNTIYPSAYAKASSRLTKADEVLSPEEQAELKKTVKKVRLIPGLNSYSIAEYNAIKDHPSVIKKFKDGRLKLWTKEELNPKDNSGDEKPIQSLPDSLDEVATASAKELAESCGDLKLLKKWLKSEEAGKARGVVLGAIEAKIEDIEEVEKSMASAGEEDRDND